MVKIESEPACVPKLLSHYPLGLHNKPRCTSVYCMIMSAANCAADGALTVAQHNKHDKVCKGTQFVIVEYNHWHPFEHIQALELMCVR